MTTAQDFENSILALESWREAWGESVDQMLCVAWTIRNLATRDTLSIGDAIRQHKNLHGLDDSNTLFPDVREPIFMRLMQRIDEVGSSYGDDLTNGAVYYVDVRNDSSPLVRELLGKPDEHPLCSVFGRRHFFR